MWSCQCVSISILLQLIFYRKLFDKSLGFLNSCQILSLFLQKISCSHRSLKSLCTQEEMRSENASKIVTSSFRRNENSDFFFLIILLNK